MRASACKKTDPGEDASIHGLYGAARFLFCWLGLFYHYLEENDCMELRRRHMKEKEKFQEAENCKAEFRREFFRSHTGRISQSGTALWGYANHRHIEEFPGGWIRQRFFRQI